MGAFLSLSLVSRMGASFFLSLLLFLLLSKAFLAYSKEKGMVDYFRLYSPSSHQSKKGTPTGGGLIILFCLAVSLFVFGKRWNGLIFIATLTIFYLGGVGAIDDLIKKHRRSSRGLSGKMKLLFQLGIALFVVLYLFYGMGKETGIVQIPFTDSRINIGLLYIPFAVSIILGSSNAVNLTDGLDGLAAGCMITPAIIFILLGYIQEDALFASLTGRVYLPGSGEISFLWCTLLGAMLGFLWYNRYPARMFMGGVGSEALGGALGVSAILLKVELFLLIFGGIFVAEAISVIIQVLFYQTQRRRIFKMTPLHHHFEIKGWEERRIVNKFWITSTLLGVTALFALFFF